MNDIYGARFPGFYIYFDENDNDWDCHSRTKFLTVKIMMPDYVKLKPVEDGDEAHVSGFTLSGGTECYPKYEPQ